MTSLQGALKSGITGLSEAKCTVELLEKHLLKNLVEPPEAAITVAADGAERAARHLFGQLQAG